MDQEKVQNQPDMTHLHRSESSVIYETLWNNEIFTILIDSWIFVDGQINKLSIPRDPGSPSQMMIGVYNHRNERQGISVPWNHCQFRWARISIEFELLQSMLGSFV